DVRAGPVRLRQAKRRGELGSSGRCRRPIQIPRQRQDRVPNPFHVYVYSIRPWQQAAIGLAVARVAALGSAPTFFGFALYLSLALSADHWARTAAARARAHAASSAAVGAISEPCMAMAAAMASPLTPLSVGGPAGAAPRPRPPNP